MKLIFFFLFLISQILGQNKIYESKDVIISYENPNLETIVFWGGIGYATPQWLESKIEKKYFKKYNIILVSYNIELEFIKKIFLEKTSQELKPEIILGFSRGGLLAQQYHTKDYKIVGLIDPVLNFKKKFAYCQNIIFVFNSHTWNREYNKTLMYFGKTIARQKGVWRIEYLDHVDFPKFFFKEFL